MIWMRRIGEDALARVERVGSFERWRLLGGTAPAGLWLMHWCTDQRKVFNWARPGDFGVIEGVIAFGPGNLWEGHDDERNMPECRSKNGAARNAAFDPGVFEKACRKQSFWRARAAEEFSEIA